MIKVPFTQRLDRWIEFTLAMGWDIERLLVHPTDYHSPISGPKSPAEKLGYIYKGLPIVSLATE